MIHTDLVVGPPKGDSMFRFLKLIFLLLAGLSFYACRATFQSIKATPPAQQQQDLEVKVPPTITPPSTPPPKGPYTMLERSRTLSDQESLARGCNGTISIFERGPDLNKDNMLQNNEITETRSECQARPNTNDCSSPTQTQGQSKPNCPTPTQSKTQTN